MRHFKSKVVWNGHNFVALLREQKKERKEVSHNVLSQGQRKSNKQKPKKKNNQNQLTQPTSYSYSMFNVNLL